MSTQEKINIPYTAVASVHSAERRLCAQQPPGRRAGCHGYQVDPQPHSYCRHELDKRKAESNACKPQAAGSPPASTSNQVGVNPVFVCSCFRRTLPAAYCSSGNSGSTEPPPEIPKSLNVRHVCHWKGFSRGVQQDEVIRKHNLQGYRKTYNLSQKPWDISMMKTLKW